MKNFYKQKVKETVFNHAKIKKGGDYFFKVGCRSLFSYFLIIATFSCLNAQKISAFRGNPLGVDDDLQPFQIAGVPGDTLDAWVLTIESDGFNGKVDNGEPVYGVFDANGILYVEVADFENPSFTIVLVDEFTGTVDVTDIDTSDTGTNLDLSTFGNILDAIGVPDSPADEQTLYGELLGGVDLANIASGDEPSLVFRDSESDELFMVNQDGDGLFDASGESVDTSNFDINPITNFVFDSSTPTSTIVSLNMDKKIDQVQSFFPNPSNGTFSYFGVIPDRILVRQLNGTFISETIGGNNVLDLSDLPNGVYLLEVFNDGLMEQHKVSISK